MTIDYHISEAVSIVKANIRSPVFVEFLLQNVQIVLFLFLHAEHEYRKHNFRRKFTTRKVSAPHLKKYVN